MGQSKISNDDGVAVNEGLLKDRNSKYKREINKNDVNIDKGELKEPTNNFRKKK